MTHAKNIQKTTFNTKIFQHILRVHSTVLWMKTLIEEQLATGIHEDPFLLTRIIALAKVGFNKREDVAHYVAH